jgi:anti-sigma28 factor (negative regulator of flagellin synthesis)/predicted nucleic acid-binding protein
MKNLFPEYFSPTSPEIEQIWESAVFVFDTNILCNLYRYPNEARNKFIEVLEQFKERIWLPNTVVEEFLRNRPNVINDQISSYQQTLKEIGKLENNLGNERAHPFLTKRSMGKLTRTLDEIKKELKESEKSHEKRIYDDEILDELTELFGFKVGEPLDSNTLEEIFNSGKSRYEHKIPPGYKDAGKADEDDDSEAAKRRRYGDLIIWKEVIEYAKENNSQVILVINDRKEDWWLKLNEKTISPRPEIIKEFYEETGNHFLMYNMERFLKYSTKKLQIPIKQSIFDDVRTIGKEKSTQNNKKQSYIKRKSIFRQLLTEMKQRKYQLTDELHMVSQKITNLKTSIAHGSYGHDPESLQELNSLAELSTELRAKLNSIDQDMFDLTSSESGADLASGKSMYELIATYT